MVLRLHQHNIGYTADGFLQVPLAPDQTIAQMWSNGVWGECKSALFIYWQYSGEGRQCSARLDF